MNAIELKTEIHALVEKINDIQLLSAVKTLLKQPNTNDWWDKISEEEKLAIEQGLAEADNENLIPHNVVMEEVKQKYASK